jgi:tRNA threonylcarbamoyladenosine biosynthesis protein TsaE
VTYWFNSIVSFSATVFLKNTTSTSFRTQRTLTLSSEGATAEFAKVIASKASAPLLIYLFGELGAGKTFFTRSFLASLGFVGRVKSPTFTLMEPYKTPTGLMVYHFDFYRFSAGNDWRDAGFEEYLPGDGVALVEWPNNAAGLPTPDVEIRINHTDNPESRTIELISYTPRGSEVCS